MIALSIQSTKRKETIKGSKLILSFALKKKRKKETHTPSPFQTKLPELKLAL